MSPQGGGLQEPGGRSKCGERVRGIYLQRSFLGGRAQATVKEWVGGQKAGVSGPKGVAVCQGQGGGSKGEMYKQSTVGPSGARTAGWGVFA